MRHLALKGIAALGIAATAIVASHAQQPPAGKATPVTVDNFIRAESDIYIGNLAKESGGLGKLHHRREPAAIDDQTVIRLNRDTLYSSGVFDLDAGPVTITMPDAGKRFMSLRWSARITTPRRSTARGRTRSTRRRSARATSLPGVRTLVDPGRPEGRRAGPRAAGRDQGQSEGHGHASSCRAWDAASQKKVRDALLVLATTHARLQEGVRHQGRGRSRAPPDRHCRRLGRQSRQGRGLPQRHAARRTTARPSTRSL